MYNDATAMAEAIKNRTVSAEECVKASIARIETLNPVVNAVVSTQYEQALECSRNLEIGDKPFAGVPILLKDLGQEQEGVLSTSGSRLFANYKAQKSDRYTQRMEELGFIVLGRTNTPEFGFKNISDSALHGFVNLPLDVTRNAGGSSGGSAAAVSSGMVVLAGASDGGGSIRIPASFNGLIGLKPSRGRIPVGPSSYRGWQGASVHFALTKSVRDTKRLLYYLQTYQVEAPFPLRPLSWASLFNASKKSLKIAFLVQSPIGTQVSIEAQAAVLQLLPILEAQGHQVTELNTYPLDGRELFSSYYMMNSVETAQMFAEIEAGLGRKMTIKDMELMTWALYRSGQTIPAYRYSQILQDWDRYSAKMAAFHEMYDVLLTPTVAGVAPEHGQFDLDKDVSKKLGHMDDYSMEEQQELIWQMFEKALAWTPFTAQANLTGQPSISLPTYQTAQGLPIGVQLTAAKGREDILFSLAEELEQLGTWS
ncbi:MULTISPECIES: amidase [unclassified Streptococcus]|uniref:amidase n=1 Tax=unclassified Streptococcus TaxID=2608887 RepID=UPI0010727034|nr:MULTISPECIES: amidase [unclassified Streptococcus]MBF0787132.1 amidase [Streptococcus sp. 19428wC2_LYSM12]MCQ9211312.1 amidase [Streptococcus sp. B01]MCQ9214624.1 amidase [Streptococcus sp. O1]TFV06016.1 amidase [Streptococcus sp. LYSM12]